MKAKQEYIDALERMTKEYYSTVRTPEECNKFNSYLRLFKGLVNEHFEEKQETNLDHYFDDLLETGGRYAFVNGKIKHCWGTRCCNCAFKGGNCNGEKIKWLASPYEKQTYKLTQFEYDSLSFPSDNEYEFGNDLWCLHMKEKGYFKGVTDTSMEIKEIIERAEVVDGENH